MLTNYQIMLIINTLYIISSAAIISASNSTILQHSAWRTTITAGVRWLLGTKRSCGFVRIDSVRSQRPALRALATAHMTYIRNPLYILYVHHIYISLSFPWLPNQYDPSAVSPQPPDVPIYQIRQHDAIPTPCYIYLLVAQLSYPI